MSAVLQSSSEEVRAESQLDPAIPLGCNPLWNNFMYANGIARKMKSVWRFEQCSGFEKGLQDVSIPRKVMKLI